MPTAARLVAAIALALAAYGVAGVAQYRFEVLNATGIDPRWIAFIAALVGWAHLGPNASKNYAAAISGGISSAFFAFALVVLAAASLHVLEAVQYHAYKDLDALLDGFIGQALHNVTYIGDWPMLGALVFGGALAGIFSAFAGRLWT